MFGGQTFVVRVSDDGASPRVARGDWVWVDPDETAADGCLVAGWAEGPDLATVVRLMLVEDGRRILRPLNAGFPDIEVTRENETMIRGTVVFAGRGV